MRGPLLALPVALALWAAIVTVGVLVGRSGGLPPMPWSEGRR